MNRIEDRLIKIKARAAACQTPEARRYKEAAYDARTASAEDVPWLIAELEASQREVKRMRAELLAVDP